MLTLYELHCCLHMSELVEIVDSLENKVSKLLHRLDAVNAENSRLTEEILSLKKMKQTTEDSIKTWENKYHALKMANTMLGSDNNKTEAKLKINTLIRELDHCIVQLSE